VATDAKHVVEDGELQENGVANPAEVQAFLLRLGELAENPQYFLHEMALRALGSEVEERGEVLPEDEQRLMEIVDPQLLKEQKKAPLSQVKKRLPPAGGALRASMPAAARPTDFQSEAELIADQATRILAERLAQELWKKKRKELLELVKDEEVKRLLVEALVQRLKKGFEE